MNPIMTQCKILTSHDFYKPDPVKHLADRITNIPNEAFQMGETTIYAMTRYSNETRVVTKKIMKPEISDLDKSRLIGCTVLIQLTTPSKIVHESMRIHIYESKKIEHPIVPRCTPIIVNFINHETSPIIACTISNWFFNNGYASG